MSLFRHGSSLWEAGSCTDELCIEHIGHLITDWNPNILHHQAMLQYSQAIRAPLNKCFGFLDGTVRPYRDQEEIRESFTVDISEFLPQCCFTKCCNWELVRTSRYAELLFTFPCVYIFLGGGRESLTIFL